MSISEISIRPSYFQPEQKEQVRVQIVSDICDPENIVESLAAIKGPVDLYFFYEGLQCLPKVGADFMKEKIFEPLYSRKKDAKLCLYSLRAWNFNKNLDEMPKSSPLGNAINKINTVAVESISSYAFFRYRSKVSKGQGLYEFVAWELPKKTWLFELSEDLNKKGKSVGTLLNNKPSLVDCIENLDLSQAYSHLQYVEGYYLIRKSVKKA